MFVVCLSEGDVCWDEELENLALDNWLGNSFRWFGMEVRQGNVKFLVREMVASPDQTRTGIRWFLSGVSWVLLEVYVPDESLHRISGPNVSRSGTAGPCLVWIWRLRSYPENFWSCPADKIIIAECFRYFGLSLWTSLLMLWDRVATIRAQRYRTRGQSIINWDVISCSNICYCTDKY